MSVYPVTSLPVLEENVATIVKEKTNTLNGLMKNKILIRHLDLAQKIALSAPGVGQRKSFKLGAVLFKGKNVYAAKHNSYKTHPALARISEYPHLHAESACCLAHGLDNCGGLDLLVTRVDSLGRRAMARPCPTCDMLLRSVGIKKVYYTGMTGELVCQAL